VEKSASAAGGIRDTLIHNDPRYGAGFFMPIDRVEEKRQMYEYEILKVERVVDGDTVDVIFDLGFEVFRRERVRLQGVDTPESVTKDLKEKKLGLETKAFVGEWLKKQKRLVAQTSKDEGDKFGRFLARIRGDTECLNEILIRDGWAWAYDGGKKVKDFGVLAEARKRAGLGS
jgi:micrococcal nuclease